MTKKELINNVYLKTGVDKSVCRVVIEEMIEEMISAVSHGEEVTIRGLFTLKPVLRKEKLARNITAGTTVSVPAHYKPTAKFSRYVIDSLMANKPYKH